MAKDDLLKMPDELERNLRALLATTPHDRKPEDRTEGPEETAPAPQTETAEGARQLPLRASQSYRLA